METTTKDNIEFMCVQPQQPMSVGEKIASEAAGSSISGALIIVGMWLWLKFGRHEGKKDICSNPVKCNLKDEEWKQNREEHNELYGRVGKLEVSVTAIKTRTDSIEGTIKEIKQISSRMDEKIDTILMRSAH